MQKSHAEALKKPKRLSNSQQRQKSRQQLRKHQQRLQLLQEKRLKQAFRPNPPRAAIRQIIRNQRLRISIE